VTWSRCDSPVQALHASDLAEFHDASLLLHEQPLVLDLSLLGRTVLVTRDRFESGVLLLLEQRLPGSEPVCALLVTKDSLESSSSSSRPPPSSSTEAQLLAALPLWFVVSLFSQLFVAARSFSMLCLGWDLFQKHETKEMVSSFGTVSFLDWKE
jgi:hypothetical protein